MRKVTQRDKDTLWMKVHKRPRLQVFCAICPISFLDLKPVLTCKLALFDSCLVGKQIAQNLSKLMVQGL